MSMPAEESGQGVQAQVLIKLGELSSDVAVVKDRLSVIPDHENRLRALERENQIRAGETAGTKDLWSRVVAGAALLAAVGSAVAQYLHP